LDIRQLRYFVGIADCGSLMKASERLHVAQPALSVHLSTLETRLGVTLMRRSSRGVELTDEGRLLYDRAIQLLRYHSETIESIKAMRVRASGSVSLGIPSTRSPMIAADLYRRVRDELPDVSLYIADASTAMLYEWLVDGRIDFSILFSVPDDAHLDSTPLQLEEFCLVSRADGKRYRATVDFESVIDLPLVLSSPSSTWRKILDDVAERNGTKLVAAVETESAGVIKSIIASGEAYGLLPLSSVYAEREAGTFRVQRIVKPEIRGVLSLVSLRSADQTPAMRAVRELVMDVIKTSDCPWDAGNEFDPNQATSVLRAWPSKILPATR
tara:strand:- start:7457 stop:8437 length:981 start_codon:yes stop_codon:yes gene_type:complete